MPKIQNGRHLLKHRPFFLELLINKQIDVAAQDVADAFVDDALQIVVTRVVAVQDKRNFNCRRKFLQAFKVQFVR